MQAIYINRMLNFKVRAVHIKSLKIQVAIKSNFKQNSPLTLLYIYNANDVLWYRVAFPIMRFASNFLDVLPRAVSRIPHRCMLLLLQKLLHACDEQRASCVVRKRSIA